MDARAVRPDVHDRFAAIERRVSGATARDIQFARRAPRRRTDPVVRQLTPAASTAWTPAAPRCGSCGGPITVADGEVVTRQAAAMLGVSESRFSILRTAAQLTPVRIIGQTNVYRRVDVEALRRRLYPDEALDGPVTTE